jgi:AcrR family transcriptional regulator
MKSVTAAKRKPQPNSVPQRAETEATSDDSQPGSGFEAKRRLLDATIEYVREYGLDGLTLRQLSAAIGTSHRMLNYHFGSKEGLLAEVVWAIEKQLGNALLEFDADPKLSPVEALRQFWEFQTRPKMVPMARMWVEVFAHALHGRPHTSSFFETFDKAWAHPFTKIAMSAGDSPAVAKVDARLALAVMRGLYLDLLTTGDRGGVDKAKERFMEMYEMLLSSRSNRSE